MSDSQTPNVKMIYLTKIKCGHFSDMKKNKDINIYSMIEGAAITGNDVQA